MEQNILQLFGYDSSIVVGDAVIGGEEEGHAYNIISSVFANPTSELNEVMKIAYNFSSYNMQEKFDAMSDVTMINHRRLKNEYIKKYGMAYECPSDNSPYLMKIFHQQCQKYGVMHDVNQIFSYLHEFPAKEPVQLSLF